MDLPSMVQRSGDTLIVRSVVSGNQLYMDQTGAGANNASAAGAPPTAGASGSASVNVNVAALANNNLQHNLSASVLEQQLERYQQQLLQQQQQQQQQQHQQQQQTHAANAQHHQQQQYQQHQQQQAQQQQEAAVAALDAKEEGLPQCKIKRNYSCSHCAYFTQNPRYHLTHLRDVHGEKIVINKCKLCLYASRHFQKLVRHMKMVHGCTDGLPGGHGQARGKRGMSREARKRRLEESVGVIGGNISSRVVPDMPTLEQVKRELQLQEQKLQRDIEAFNRQQEEQQQMANSANLFAIAFKRQLQAQRERERELEARRSYEREQSPTVSNNNNTTNAGTTTNKSNMTSLYHPNVELATPSPSGSVSPPSNAGTPNPTNVISNVASYAHDEQPQHRLLKCSLCDFTTLYRAQLVDHELEDHCKTKFFRCEKCSYVTHIKARFSKHVKYHSMPMIKCVTCDFRTPYKWNLDRHMKNHGGAGPFKCAACDFTADIKQSLTVHEMNHHVPPVGNAAGISLARRRNKVGGTDASDDFLSDSAELEDQFNNNMDEEYDEATLLGADAYGKRSKYADEDEPTDLSQKGGGSASDTSSNRGDNATPKSRRPMPNLIPITKSPKAVLDLSKDINATRSSLTEIASMFFSEQQISEMLDKSDVAAQLSPSTTITSAASNHSHPSRNLLSKKSNSNHGGGGNFFDKLKSSALAAGVQHENLICQCGFVAKCLSESIIHGKTCNFSAVVLDDDIDDEPYVQYDGEDRLEIDEDDDDKQSHSALNLSVTGSTRCQHCRHRCKSSVDLLNHLKQCAEAIRCANEMYDSTNSGEGGTANNEQQQSAVQQQRVCIWNAKAKEIAAAVQVADKSSPKPGAIDATSPIANASNDENSYYGVETAPGYGEVTKKMTPEEEAANSSLKKVYKCPHCSFWASTASRFHVHIVGHLNKKPFECSLCSYRSNWRWDITKHIRLKTIRDPSHKTAKVLMNDETGRRNYTKYNKYITLMKVTEEDGDPKLMKSGEMTPNQVASLAFLKDYNKIGNQSSLNNGIREDITLEPVSSTKLQNVASLDENQLADNFIRLPLLATMMNAAMAQQQHQQQQQQKEQQEQNTTALITPSVTISPVKRSPPPLVKPSDDLITEVHQEANEKKTYYRCRKCNFRHQNRDAVLAHVKIHYQDPNFPIVTATLNSSPKTSTTTPLQVAVNSNQLYMNKVFADMCLSQQQKQQQPPSSPTVNSVAINSTHSIIPAGLLQQAIQQAQNSPTPNATALSGLALALAGKCPTAIASDVTTTINAVGTNATTPKRNAASILEHGEQKASQNERHCRLKHSGDIRIETLDRSGHSANALSSPIYRPLGNANANNSGIIGNINESTNSYSLTQKALQQQQQQQQQQSPILQRVNNSNNANNSNNNNGSLLQNKTDVLLHSPLAASAVAAAVSAASAASTPQDLQTAAAYWAAAYKAATSGVGGLSAEDLLQLQNNDQIEITRLPSTNNSSNNAANLAQLLEQATVAAQAAVQNSNNNNNNNTTKNKQQKCPICPHISESKSQMNYHISLHKPTQYECHLCTFVCAKKQHLSSHMRTVHQQQLANNAVGGSVAAAGGVNSLNLDFTVALQLAAAAQAQAQQQQQDTLKAPLAIDLSSLKQTLQPSLIKSSSDELPPEYQYKLISYCSKCPARFAQKHNEDAQHRTQIELAAHLRAHEAGANEDAPFVCVYCEYHTADEQELQIHRAVHMTHYQEKYDELYKNCKEDAAHPAPKMMQITCTKTQMPEAIWVVDNELSAQLREQHASLSSPPPQTNYDSNNSLLKKQLESGGSAVPAHQFATTTQPEAVAALAINDEEAVTIGSKMVPMDCVDADDDDDDGQTNSMPSTSASVATSDLAADASSDAASCDMPPQGSQPERCLHCPYESHDLAQFKQHVQKHICVSKRKEAYTCDHCDYTDDSEAHIEVHTTVHFDPTQKLKSVEFFTSYDNLEISVEKRDEQDDDDDEEPTKELHIKQEHQIPEHNNNLDNVINENTRHQSEQQNSKFNADAADASEEAKKPTKIILYKNEGGLSVKKETNSPCSDNISDRLRRRILRGNSNSGSSNNNNNGGGSVNASNNNAIANDPEDTVDRSKMIIVNAKTGKVLSRK